MGNLPGAETSVVDDHHNILLTAIGEYVLAKLNLASNYFSIVTSL